MSLTHKKHTKPSIPADGLRRCLNNSNPKFRKLCRTLLCCLKCEPLYWPWSDWYKGHHTWTSLAFPTCLSAVEKVIVITSKKKNQFNSGLHWTSHYKIKLESIIQPKFLECCNVVGHQIIVLCIYNIILPTCIYLAR